VARADFEFCVALVVDSVGGDGGVGGTRRICVGMVKAKERGRVWIWSLLLRGRCGFKERRPEADLGWKVSGFLVEDRHETS
jgi:hypothetical protein